jgi:hypothetical protein
VARRHVQQHTVAGTGPAGLLLLLLALELMLLLVVLMRELQLHSHVLRH